VGNIGSQRRFSRTAMSDASAAGREQPMRLHEPLPPGLLSAERERRARAPLAQPPGDDREPVGTLEGK
jgi:hypothetical protein